jgi:general nucleoside transport system permease protein
MAKFPFKLEPRLQPSNFWVYSSPVLALLITVVVGVILFLALGKDPLRGLEMFFWQPIRSPYALGELMVKATPLLVIALGLAVCFRSNVMNIGAEGRHSGRDVLGRHYRCAAGSVQCQ